MNGCPSASIKQPLFARPHILCLLEHEPLHLLCDLYLGEVSVQAFAAARRFPLPLAASLCPCALAGRYSICSLLSILSLYQERGLECSFIPGPASVHYTAVCIYSRRSTPLTRRSKSSAWSFASSRTLSWPKPALPLWLAASVRPKTFMPRACAMMTSFTVDMPT